MNIWIVNPFDPLPGEPKRTLRYGFLADMLVKKGHKVTWWSSNFFHMNKSIRCEGQKEFIINENYKIICLKVPIYKKNISLKRVWNHIIYAIEFFKNAKKLQETPDVILASVPPLFSAKAAIWLAKSRGTVCVLDIQDLWPEMFELTFPCKLRFMAKIIFYPLKKLADSIYKDANAIIGVSKTFVERGIQNSRNKNIKVIPLCADIKWYDYVTSQILKGENSFKKTDGELWYTYLGLIGYTYDLKTVLATAKLIACSHPRIRFFITGTGPNLNKLQKIKERDRIENVVFTGFLDIEKWAALLRQSDVGLTPYIADTKQSLPNKPFDYMAFGLPIINSLKGELEELIKSQNIGIQYEAGNDDSLKNAILELYNNPRRRKQMGDNARRLVEERFDKNKRYPEIEKFLKKFTR